MEVRAEDEFQHPPPGDPRWREGYHFNGYDPALHLGLSISVGIRPLVGFREEVVIVHLPDPLLFLNLRPLAGDDALRLGSLQLEPVVPLEQWDIHLADSLQEMKDGDLTGVSRQVAFDLHFASNLPPYGYATGRGARYEQPGCLTGEIRFGERTLVLEGRGIRDHSWEIREMLRWDALYSLMGWFESGEALDFTHIRSGGQTSCEGWHKTDHYDHVSDVRIEPLFSEDILQVCHVHVQTSTGHVLEVSAQVLSFACIPLGGPGQGKLAETIVQLRLGQSHGHGFLWYRK